MWRIIGVLLVLGAVAVVIGAGGAAAQNQPPTPPASPAADRAANQQQGELVGAIAMGQLRQADGGTATIDLHAGTRDGNAIGNLRFYSPTYGYYNGAVRSLTIVSGAIHATGGGLLHEPNGEHERVQFTADISTDGQRVTIAVQEQNGETYAMSGRLDPGFVRSGSPRDLLGSSGQDGQRPRPSGR